jgi:hypothetical protein
LPALDRIPPKIFPAARNKSPATPVIEVWKRDINPLPHLSQWNLN